MDNQFLQQMALNNGLQRDPVTGALLKQGPEAQPLLPPSNPQGTAQTLGDPQAQAMMMAMQNAVAKRKQNHWPETATVVHPTNGQVISPIDVAAVRD